VVKAEPSAVTVKRGTRWLKRGEVGGSPTPVRGDWGGTTGDQKAGHSLAVPPGVNPLVLVSRDLPRVVQTGGKEEGEERRYSRSTAAKAWYE
jgi:hypothetical protein